MDPDFMECFHVANLAKTARQRKRIMRTLLLAQEINELEIEMTLKKQVEQMARNAKKAGFSRNKALRHAPTKQSLRDIFMAEYDRYQPRSTSS